MTDPVSDELEQRLHSFVPWRSSLAVAVGFHLLVAAALVLAPRGRERRLVLPSVQVRIGVAAPVAAPAPARAPGVATRAGLPEGPVTRVAAQKREPKEPPAKPRKELPEKVTRAVAAATPLPSEPPRPQRAAQETTSGEMVGAGDGASAGAAGGGKPSSGGIGLGQGASGTDEEFPYAYYLNRLLGVIESNWFRPPAPPDTHCRVRCRIDRSGGLLEAGIEEASPWPAFDRAALRAVYASAPFPPLPQGFAGSSLTLHLEFGP